MIKNDIMYEWNIVVGDNVGNSVISKIIYSVMNRKPMLTCFNAMTSLKKMCIWTLDYYNSMI